MVTPSSVTWAAVGLRLHILVCVPTLTKGRWPPPWGILSKDIPHPYLRTGEGCRCQLAAVSATGAVWVSGME